MWLVRSEPAQPILLWIFGPLDTGSVTSRIHSSAIRPTTQTLCRSETTTLVDAVAGGRSPRNDDDSWTERDELKWKRC
jgi:hypothetical protein